jgi:hypothetical protein
MVGEKMMRKTPRVARPVDTPRPMNAKALCHSPRYAPAARLGATTEIHSMMGIGLSAISDELIALFHFGDSTIKRPIDRLEIKNNGKVTLDSTEPIPNPNI